VAHPSSPQLNYLKLMTNPMKYSIILTISALGFAPTIAQQGNPCPEAQYEDHNQVNPKPLRLAKVQGRGVVEIRDNVVQPGETVPGACLSLFTTDLKLVDTTKADSSGEFRFHAVDPGHYRLIARALGFCTANIPVEIVKASRKLQRKELVVHYRLTGVDVCSWGESGDRKRRNDLPMGGLELVRAGGWWPTQARVLARVGSSQG
jgi:hypothetical protein